MDSSTARENSIGYVSSGGLVGLEWHSQIGNFGGVSWQNRAWAWIETPAKGHGRSTQLVMADHVHLSHSNEHRRGSWIDSGLKTLHRTKTRQKNWINGERKRSKGSGDPRPVLPYLVRLYSQGTAVTRSGPGCWAVGGGNTSGFPNLALIVCDPPAPYSSDPNDISPSFRNHVRHSFGTLDLPHTYSDLFALV
jgi:hypothetical protein